MKLYWRYKKDGKWTWARAQRALPSDKAYATPRLRIPEEYLEWDEE